MAKPDKPNKPDNKNKRTKLERRAARDVRISQRPAIQAYDRAMVGTDNAYGGFQDLIAPLAGQYGTQTDDISANLQAQLAALSGALGGDTPVAGESMLSPAEQQAGANMGTVLGAGANELLASQEARNLGYNQSAVREGGLAQRSAHDNLLQGRLGLLEQRPQLIRQREDELRQQQLENSLVKSQIAGDAAFSDYLQNLLGGMIGNGGGGGGNPNDNGNTNPNNVDLGPTDPSGNPITPPTPPGDPNNRYTSWMERMDPTPSRGDPLTRFLTGELTWEDLSPTWRQQIRGDFRDLGQNPRKARRRVARRYGDTGSTRSNPTPTTGRP